MNCSEAEAEMAKWRASWRGHLPGPGTSDCDHCSATVRLAASGSTDQNVSRTAALFVARPGSVSQVCVGKLAALTARAQVCELGRAGACPPRERDDPQTGLGTVLAEAVANRRLEMTGERGDCRAVAEQRRGSGAGRSRALHGRGLPHLMKGRGQGPARGVRIASWPVSGSAAPQRVVTADSDDHVDMDAVSHAKDKFFA